MKVYKRIHEPGAIVTRVIADNLTNEEATLIAEALTSKFADVEYGYGPDSAHITWVK